MVAAVGQFRKCLDPGAAAVATVEPPKSRSSASRRMTNKESPSQLRSRSSILAAQPPGRRLRGRKSDGGTRGFSRWRWRRFAGELRGAAPRAEWLMAWDGDAAVGAGGGDGLAQDEVEEESEQVGKQGCDQNPEGCAHAAALCVGRDKAEAEEPNGKPEARHQRRGTINGCGPQHGALIRRGEGGEQPDQQCEACKDPRPELNCLRNNAEEIAEFHRDLSCRGLPALLDATSAGKSSKTKSEGAIQKASSPCSRCVR